jgi:aminoglycoside/choline kinase family phosphotransferase
MIHPSPLLPILRDDLELNVLELRWLAGDGSDRSYYEIRLPEGLFALMVLGEKDKVALEENRYDWVSVQQFLANTSIHVPRVEKIFHSHGLLLLEHLGNNTLEKKIEPLLTSPSDHVEELSTLYRSLFPLLSQFLSLPQNPCYAHRAFDSALLQKELLFFYEHFFHLTLRKELTPSQEESFLQDISALSEFLEKESHYFVHRDFHARNLLYKEKIPYVIDFQDARLGSPTYDLISLIWDPYVSLPIPQRKQLFEEGLLAICPAQRENESWKPVLLQRLLKILGSYGYLTRTKPVSYLAYVEPTLSFLQAIPLSDARWPFLSGPFLTLLQKKERGGR